MGIATLEEAPKSGNASNVLATRLASISTTDVVLSELSYVL